MRRSAASSIGASWVDGGRALLDIHDLTFLIHHKCGPIRHAVLRHQNTISGGNFAVIEIAQKREGSVELGGEFLLGRGVVGTNAKNLRVVAVKFCNTSLVCGDFAGSATGEGGGEECQHHGILAAETGERHLRVLGGRQCEVGRHVAFLQTGVGWLDVLGEEARGEHAGCEGKYFSHVY